MFHYWKRGNICPVYMVGVCLATVAKSSHEKKIVAVAVTSVCQTVRNKRSCSDLMCGDCLAQPHEYLFHPWTVLVLQVPAEWHPCCSCLQPSHWVTNQSSRTHLAHPSGSWHWRNQWDSWREGHSPALCLSILRYLEFQLERGQFAVGLRAEAMGKVWWVAHMMCDVGSSEAGQL